MSLHPSQCPLDCPDNCSLSVSPHDSTAVIEPVGKSRSNHRVFADLLNAMGLEKDGDPRTEDELADAWLARMPGLRSQVEANGIAEPPIGNAPIQFAEVHPLTHDGKIHLCPEDLDEEAPYGICAYQICAYQEDPGTNAAPLALISPARGEMISSTLGQLHPEGWPARLHPKDAEQRGIVENDRVRIFNELGEVICRATLAPELRPGVVELAKGLWTRRTENGATANAPAPDSLTDLGAGACFNDARVQVELATSWRGSGRECHPPPC